MAKAKEELERYETYRDLRREHLTQVELDQDFTLNKQWTKDEERELNSRGQAPLVINRIFPVVMQEQAILCANKPEFRVTAREDGDVEVAKVGSDILTFIQDRNDFELTFPKITYDFLVNGVGYGFVYKDEYTPEGAEVGMSHLEFKDVYIDPYSKKADFSDSERQLVSKLLTKKGFLRLYPDKGYAIGRMQKDFGEERGRYNIMGNEYNVKFPQDIYDPMRDLYRVTESYYKSRVPMVRVFDKTSRKTLYYDKKAFEKVSQQPAVKEAISAGIWTLLDVWKDKCYVDIICGNEVLYDKVELPTSHYPIIPFVNLHIGTPYAIGDVRFLRGIQREINKRRSLLIAHATTSMASKLLVEQGSVDDVEEVERKNARPGSVIEYAPGFNPPTQSMPQPLPNGLFTLEDTAKYDLEYLSGLFSLSQGSAKEAPDTFRATLAIEEYGNRRLNMKLRHLTNGLTRMGRVVWDYMQSVYDYDKVIRIVRPDTKDEEILRLGLVTNISDETLEKVFDVTTGTYDIKCVAGSTMASNRWAEAQEYKEWYQLGIIDQEEVLKKTDIFDRKGILERTGTIQQLSAQLEQLNSVVEKSQKEIEARDKNITSLLQQLVKLQFQLQEAKKASTNDEKSEGDKNA